MKRILPSLILTLMLALSLTACAPFGAAKPSGDAVPQSTPAASADRADAQQVRGVINRVDNYLVLLTDDEEYQVMDLAEGVTLDGFAEGDRVTVTYTGKLGVEEHPPVITAIAKEDA